MDDPSYLEEFERNLGPADVNHSNSSAAPSDDNPSQFTTHPGQHPSYHHPSYQYTQGPPQQYTQGSPQQYHGPTGYPQQQQQYTYAYGDPRAFNLPPQASSFPVYRGYYPPAPAQNPVPTGAEATSAKRKRAPRSKAPAQATDPAAKRPRPEVPADSSIPPQPISSHDSHPRPPPPLSHPITPVSSTPVEPIPSHTGPVHGIGPIQRNAVDLLSVLDTRTSDATGATDCWYLTSPASTKTAPADFVPSAFDIDVLAAETPNQVKQQCEKHKVESDSERPTKSSHIQCRLCPKWKAWARGVSGGTTTTIRTHMLKKHRQEYRHLILTHHLKGYESISTCSESRNGTGSAAKAKLPFSQTEFRNKLARFIIADDQSINVVECIEFRDLIMYASEYNDDLDIPHRTYMTKLIAERHVIDYGEALAHMKGAGSRISLTSDLWSNLRLLGFMAITAHYVAVDGDGHLKMYSRLIAFRSVPMKHTGVNLGRIVFEILQEQGLLHRIGFITLDNAANNDTMMRELERLLTRMGIHFEREGNRIRCFPHVLNIAVQAALKAITKAPPAIVEKDTGDDSDYDPEDFDENTPELASSLTSTVTAASNSALQDDLEYAEALLRDPIVRARKLVTKCRSSYGRRYGLREIIQEGNKNKSFQGGRKIETFELLRDVDTRWSSLFFMIDRFLNMYEGIQLFLDKPAHTNIRDMRLDDMEIRVLSDIRQFLLVFHVMQEVLSYEKTPTLAMTIPTYENLLNLLRMHRTSNLKPLAHAINIAIGRIEKYMAKARKTRVYSLSMVVHPHFKFAWIKKYWKNEAEEEARRWTRELVCSCSV
ncbi:hypothetical protein EUX98_g9621 [Antrodiella citrinella]|uniref:BED-type domain-containing protein n=1 Tax=Antrodiella citrinella TaxID=2447956 RepID=A0A4S4LQ15_9APHY|nr:hypothetical protein EUX98_g9621 [Antrodiella citrinella]